MWKHHEKLGLHQVLKYFFILQEISWFVFTSQCSSMQGIQSIGKNIITWSIWRHFNLSFLYIVCSWFITAHKLIVQIKSDSTKTAYSIAKCIYFKLISAPLWNLYMCHIYFEPDSNNRLALFGREIYQKPGEVHLSTVWELYFTWNIIHIPCLSQVPYHLWYYSLDSAAKIPSKF